MSLFPPGKPHLFAMLPGTNFADGFAKGFHERLGGLLPEDRAQAVVMVNTSQAMRSIEESLADLSPGPGILPKIQLIADMHKDTLSFLDIPQAVSAQRRRLQLTRLVEAFLASSARAGEKVAPKSAAVDLADELALLMDQFHDEALPVDRLQDALEGSEFNADIARHWENTLEFVDLIRRFWPGIRDEKYGDMLDPRERQRAVIDRTIAQWRADPPTHPIIAVASTGSVAATAVLLAEIARLPSGAVILPGYDPDIDPDIWSSATADHPFGPFQRTFWHLDVNPSAVEPWVAQTRPARLDLLNQALRPAPVTDKWHDAAQGLGAEIDDATKGLTLIEAGSQRAEAEAIAVAIRETLETPGRTASLITPDAALARRVSAALGHFGIEADDTLGQPLAQSPPGTLLRLMLEVAAGDGDPVTWSALFQHPLVSPGLDRKQHLDFARAYERQVLRVRRAHRLQSLLPRWPKGDDAEQNWLGRLENILAPLTQALGLSPLSDLIVVLRSAAEALTLGDPADGPSIWKGEAGEALDGFLASLARDADAYGDEPVTDFAALLLGLMRGEQIRPLPRRPHPRVRFSGPREARLESADLVILGGLNDGTWPEIPDAGPWLSRPMRETLGLPLPERSVGLSAHDFLNAAARPDVILSRSKKAQGAATIASRWMIRLETLMLGIGAKDAWTEMRERGDRLLAISDHLSTPQTSEPPAARPAPAPALEHRPRRLSVTGIETLIRDAYAIYARNILGLRPLDPLHRQIDARDRGTVLHKVLEEFLTRTRDWPGPDQAAKILSDTADEVLNTDVPEPDLRRIWRARIGRFAEWFITEETRRRSEGHPLAWEVAGSLMLDLPGGPFQITAKADRIDSIGDRKAAIYDYKSGEPPTKSQIEAGFNHQLHVQAAILQAGGFDVDGDHVAALGAYLGLTGSDAGGKETAIQDLQDQVAQHMARVAERLTQFDEGAPYVSHGRPQFTRYEGDYDHLARVGEWTLGGET